eukprot:Sdes_comp18909_c0_seq1m9358
MTSHNLNELEKNLHLYQNQLQQVDAALSTDAENEELKKLQSDLSEVISVTLDLIKMSNPLYGSTVATSSGGNWQVGDTCRAVYSTDGNYYPAVILSFDSDGSKCRVRFEGYGNVEDVQLASLLKIEEDIAPEDGSLNSMATMRKSSLTLSSNPKSLAQRELKKIKSQKKKEKLLLRTREQEEAKTNWLKFNQKTNLKSKTGFLSGKAKTSIFASPDTIAGRVGVVGSGQVMTSFPSKIKHISR